MRELSSPRCFPLHKETATNPAAYYSGMMASVLFPSFFNEFTIQLTQGKQIDLRHFMDFFIYKEIFIERCYDVELPTSAPGIIDVGANIGMFALRMKQLYPAARILCFEPSPDNFARLQATVRRNRLADVACFPEAVAGSRRTARLFLHPRSHAAHSLRADAPGDGRSLEVSCIDLPSALARLGRRCDLLKLDCEGAEHEIVKSLGPAEARAVRRLVFEASDHLYPVEELAAHLGALGYRVTRAKGLHRAERAD